MKTLIKNFSSQEPFGTEKNIVKLYEENGIYSVEYKYTTMYKYKILRTNDIKHAELDFIKYVMSILS